MKLTVNIISFRYGHLVANAVESVLAQTRQAGVTLRVFDDGVGDCPQSQGFTQMWIWWSVRPIWDKLLVCRMRWTNFPRIDV